MAEQVRAIAVAEKSQEQSQAEANAAGAQAVKAEQAVETVRRTEITAAA